MPENIPPFPEYEPRPDFHSVYSIQIIELIYDGFIKWSDSSWKWDYYDIKQYYRICKGIEGRYGYREISMLPPGKWKAKFLYKMNYEIMPKYKLLYELIDDGKLNILQDEDEFGKSRDITSGFPETLLSGNSDYASSGIDKEFETVLNGSVLDKLLQFAETYKGVDELILDELEILFVSSFTVNMNSW